MKGFAIFILLVIVGMFFLGKSQTPEQRAASNCKSETTAFVMSQSFVKQVLKAPATAVFPYITDSGVVVRQLPDCQFSVLAHVDSENGFGALIRSKYVMKVRYNKGSDDWSGSDLIIN